MGAPLEAGAPVSLSQTPQPFVTAPGSGLSGRKKGRTGGLLWKQSTCSFI